MLNDSGSDSSSYSKDSITKRRPNKTVCPFSDHSEHDSSDDDRNDI